MTYDAHNDPQHVPGVAYVNPGTGPAEDATLEHARHAMLMLMQDAFGSVGWATDREMLERPGVEWWFERRPDLDEDGRFGFELRGGDIDWAIEVVMPGLPLEQVRYTDADDQNIWHFPHLYIDGNSRVWCYGVGVLQEKVGSPTLPPAA